MNDVLRVYCNINDASRSVQGPLACAEVTFYASPAMLRKIGEFLVQCANKFDIEPMESPDHIHFRDSWKVWNTDYPDVIAMLAGGVEQSGA